MVVVSAVRDDRGLPLPAVCSTKLLCATSAESHPMSVFSIVLRVFLDESLRRKRFRFLQALIKILSIELNIFPYSISLHYYYARGKFK